MPAGLDKLQKKIWDELKGKTNPRTNRAYTESESWAIAKSQWKKSGKSLNIGIDSEEPSELLKNAIGIMEES